MILYYENIITDLRRNNIKVTQKVFDYLNDYVDLQNSTIERLELDTYRDLRDRNVLVVDDSNIVAVYGQNKFMYNPNKIKASTIPEFDVYEVIQGGVNVQNRREQRRDYLKGLSSTKDSKFSNVPRSSNYVWDKDWDPEVNKRYYTKLLQQNHLGRYAEQLNNAYDVVKELIDQRRERLTGKRSEYDRMITNISKQINRIEDEMVAAERDFSFDPDKLKKEISKLPRMIEDAKFFIDTENKEFAVTSRYNGTGRRKPIPYTKIEK